MFAKFYYDIESTPRTVVQKFAFGIRNTFGVWLVVQSGTRKQVAVLANCLLSKSVMQCCEQNFIAEQL